MSSVNQPPFFVQVGVPRTADLRAMAVFNLQEAVGEIFAFPTEFIICYINGVAIPFSYKYDLSDHIEPGLQLLENVIENMQGAIRETFASNDIYVDLDLRWDGDLIQINANWVRVSGDVDLIKRNCSGISISKSAFLIEFKMILDVIEKHVGESQVTLEDKESLQRLQKLKTAIVALGSHAFLY